LRYRRADIKGGTYFFTINLAERHLSLLTDHIDILRKVINQVKNRHPFVLDAMVILPDHLHAMITLPEGGCNYAMRWRLIKSGFSRHLPKSEKSSASRKKKGERGIWQRRYWEHLIRDDADYEQHANYIHYNPVKHGYVEQAGKWPYSTIHSHIEKGLLPCDWGGVETDEFERGERV